MQSQQVDLGLDLVLLGQHSVAHCCEYSNVYLL